MRRGLGGGIVARRRPPEPVVDPTLLWAPDYLLAGRCHEVWAADLLPLVRDEDSWLTFTVAVSHRYRNARTAWFHCHDLDARGRDPRVPAVLAQGGSPWSFRAAVERGDVADLLERRGLPADWKPVPAPRPLLDLPRHWDGPVPEALAALLTR